MKLLEQLFGKKEKTQQPEPTTTPPRAAAGPATPPPDGKPRRIYLYVAATSRLDEVMVDQIQTYGLQLLRLDPTFKIIMDCAAADKVPTVSGYGLAESPAKFVDAFSAWLKGQNLSLDDARPVLGKKFFVQGGDSQNPMDGKKFSWGLIGCFM